MKTRLSVPSRPAPAPLPHWLGEALVTCAQFLFEQGALEMLALQGRALLHTNVPLDLGPGRWLLVRFPAPAAETDPQFLALLAPCPPDSSPELASRGTRDAPEPQGESDDRL